MKSLLFVFSYHHQNTMQIAEVIAKVLDAQIKTPKQINPEEIHKFSFNRLWLRYIWWKAL